MGLFDGLFGKKQAGTVRGGGSVPWITLKSIEQLTDILERSEARPQIIYKHSTTCGVSSMVLRMFTEDYDLPEGAADLYFLDLHAYREVSNALAHQFGVVHESPQLIIVKGGEVVAHASHGAIAGLDIREWT